jgi:glycosyltransferase involved in cell wall biosynthesis
VSAAPRVVLACDFFLRYTAALAGGLSRAGAEATLLTRDHGLEFGGRPGAAAEFVASTAGPRVRCRLLPGRVRSAAGWAETLRSRSELRRLSPDVVHVQESIANDPRLLIAAGARRGRYALTVHDPVRHPGDRNSWRIERSNRALARNAGLIFVHGEALRDELLRLAAPRAPIVVVPHGIDRGEAPPLPERPGVLFFGRISHYKGLDVLLDAMAELWKALPEATLTIAGEGEIEAHAALSDPRVSVRRGHVPDGEVAGLIEAASCLALPYRQASQSGVGSLGKAFGRPLVVSAVGSLPELVADGSGIAVPAEDPGALAGALVEVLSDRELAGRLGAAGARFAGREGSWDSVAERTLEAYRAHLPGGRT